MCWVESLWNGLFYPQKKNPDYLKHVNVGCSHRLYSASVFRRCNAPAEGTNFGSPGASAPTTSLVPTPPLTSANNTVIDVHEKLDPDITHFT